MQKTRHKKVRVLRARCEAEFPTLIEAAARYEGLDSSAFVRSTLYERAITLLGRDEVNRICQQNYGKA